MESVTIPRAEFEQMKREIDTLKESKLYKRLLEFEKNISEGKKCLNNTSASKQL